MREGGTITSVVRASMARMNFIFQSAKGRGTYIMFDCQGLDQQLFLVGEGGTITSVVRVGIAKMNFIFQSEKGRGTYVMLDCQNLDQQLYLVGEDGTINKCRKGKHG